MPSSIETDTRERLLNAAEVLFARYGYEAMGLRELTREAGVNLAAVHYHFGSKRELVMEMLRRHIEPINRQRLERLEVALEHKSAKPSVRAIVAAFIEPMLEHVSKGRDVHLFQMVGRCITAPVELDEAIYKEFFEELVGHFLTALGKALPHLSEGMLRMRFHFMVSSLLGVMIRMGAIHRDGMHRIGKTFAVDDAIADLCDFLTAALKAPVREEER